MCIFFQHDAAGLCWRKKSADGVLQVRHESQEPWLGYIQHKSSFSRRQNFTELAASCRGESSGGGHLGKDVAYSTSVEDEFLFFTLM